MACQRLFVQRVPKPACLVGGVVDLAKTSDRSELEQFLQTVGDLAQRLAKIFSNAASAGWAEVHLVCQRLGLSQSDGSPARQAILAT